MALGATAWNVRALVLRQGLVIGSVAMLLWLGAAATVARVVQPLMFGVTASDPSVPCVTANSMLTTTSLFDGAIEI